MKLGVGSHCNTCKAEEVKLSTRRRANGAPARNLAVVPTLPSAVNFVEAAERAIAERAASPDPFSDAQAVQLRRIAERLDGGGHTARMELDLLSAWGVAIKEAGLTVGPRRSKPAAEAAPALRDVSSY